MTTKTEDQEILIPGQALEKVDLTLPERFAVEIAASQMVEHLTMYHRAARELKSARHGEDHRRADELSRTVLFCRNTIALLQYEFPSAKAIANQGMEDRVRELSRNRERNV